MTLTPAQLDRACGAILGTAVGDALGAPYEFGHAKLGSNGPQMIGGGLGNFAPGEWTDDTSMAAVIAEVAATGVDLRSERAQDAIAEGFVRWYRSNPPDVAGLRAAAIGRLLWRRDLGAVTPKPTNGARRRAESAAVSRVLAPRGPSVRVPWPVGSA